MKHKVLFALCCLLLFGGFNAAAQDASPLPAPDEETSPLPGPDEDQSSAIAEPGKATDAQAPAQSGGRKGRGGGSGLFGRGGGSAAQPASASSQDGIPAQGRYWGAMAGYVRRDYETENIPSLDGKGSFSAGFLLGSDHGSWALQTEILLTGDHAKYKEPLWYSPYYGSDKRDVSGLLLNIPLLFKLDLHLWKILLQPYAGLYLNLGLGDLDWESDDPDPYYHDSGTFEYENPLFGVMYGGTLGFRIGRGYLFADFRYAGDLGSTEVKTGGGTGEFDRSAFMINLGYQRYF